MSDHIVETSYGKIQGQVRSDLHVFRGIPFAAPPVGERRWLAPEPPESWAGVRAAVGVCVGDVGGGVLVVGGGGPKLRGVRAEGPAESKDGDDEGRALVALPSAHGAGDGKDLFLPNGRRRSRDAG